MKIEVALQFFVKFSSIKFSQNRFVCSRVVSFLRGHSNGRVIGMLTPLNVSCLLTIVRELLDHLLWNQSGTVH
jgi:hypothetical protein